MPRRVRFLLPGLLLLLACYAGLCAVLWLIQDRLILPDTTLSAPLRSLSGEYRVSDWRINGVWAGYVLEPDTSAAASAAPVPVSGTVLVLHGNEETAEDKLALARVFLHEHERVVLPEYPAHGRRPGERSMQAVLAASRAALQQAVSRYPGPMYLVGESLGAGMAAQLVPGNEARLAAILLITPWDNLASVAQQHYPVVPVRYLLHADFDSVRALQHYNGPLLLIGAGRDETIPLQHARNIISAHPGAQMLVLPDSDHDHWADFMHARDWQTVLSGMGLPHA